MILNVFHGFRWISLVHKFHRQIEEPHTSKNRNSWFQQNPRIHELGIFRSWSETGVSSFNHSWHWRQMRWGEFLSARTILCLNGRRAVFVSAYCMMKAQFISDRTDVVQILSRRLNLIETIWLVVRPQPNTFGNILKVCIRRWPYPMWLTKNYIYSLKGRV